MADVLLHAGSLEQFRQRHCSLLTLPGNGHQQEAGMASHYLTGFVKHLPCPQPAVMYADWITLHDL